jgi:GT2 family glycosyltransferase
MIPSMDSTDPLFSVIILCWNSDQTISKCLDALAAQTYKDFEIILVDNGSSVPITSELVERYPYLRINFYPLEKNLGFAGGNNFAVSKVKTDYIVLLNADAFPKPDWIENIYQGVIKYPGSFFATKQINANQPDRLDGTGDVYHITGWVWRKSYNTLVSDYVDREGEVFSACGAAAVFPTLAFREVNGFDDEYFSYLEDIDLGFRLRLKGYRCIYLPAAIVFHVGSGSTSRRSDLAVYYSQRNLVWTFIKDMPGIWVWVLAPLHILANFFMIALSITRKQGKVTISAKWEAIRKFRSINQKRKQIQSTRVASAWKVIKIMDWNPISPMIKLIHR